MELQTIESCINCQNLTKNFMCSKHSVDVGMYTVCESHTKVDSLTKNSNCANCAHFNLDTCTNPDGSSKGMLCFDWKSDS